MDICKEINHSKATKYFNYTYRDFEEIDKNIIIESYESFISIFQFIFKSFQTNEIVNNPKSLMNDLNRIFSLFDLPDLIQDNCIEIKTKDLEKKECDMEDKFKSLDSMNKYEDKEIKQIFDDCETISVGFLFLFLSLFKCLEENEISCLIKVINEKKNTLKIHNEKVEIKNNYNLFLNNILVYGSYAFYNKKYDKKLNNKNGLILGTVIFFNLNKEIMDKIIKIMDKDKLTCLLKISNYDKFIEECYNLLSSDNSDNLLEYLTGLEKKYINNYDKQKGKDLLHFIDNNFKKLIDDKEIVFSEDKIYNLLKFESYENSSPLFKHFIKLVSKSMIRSFFTLDELYTNIDKIKNEISELFDEMEIVRPSKKLEIMKKFILN